LQIVDDKLYFTGLREIAEKVYDPWVEAKNKYSIYSYDLETTQSGFVEKEKFMNVISFYIPDDGYKMICSGSINEVLYLLKNDEVISREDQSVKTVSFNYKDEEVKNDFYIIGGTIIAAQWLNGDVHYNNFPVSSHPYVIDRNSGELALEYLTDTYQKDQYKAFYMDENSLYCSYNEMVVIVDRSTFEVINSFIPEELTEDYNIAYMTKLGNNIYFIADKWRDTAKKTPPLVSEVLYIMDPETFEYKAILNLKSNNRILALDKDYIIIKDGNGIYKYDFNIDTLGDKQKLCNTPQDFSSKNYLVDIAGNWMFIYKIYPEVGSPIYEFDLPGQQLVYKINLQNGEVIQNTGKLDFSVVEEYIVQN